MKKEYHNYYRQLGFNIAYYRKMQNFTQEGLAELLGISLTHMGRMEIANVGVSLDMLFKISETLDVPVYKFFVFRD